MNKKGFTLVELLAVIAILAILVILAIPSVLDIYNNSREKIRVQTVKTYINATKKFYMKENLSNSKLLDGETNIIEELNMDGKKVDAGYVVVTSKGEVKVALEIDNKCYKNDGDEIIVEEDYDICDVVTNRIKDDTPGELAGGGRQNNPYKIESIEDLVAFSNMVNEKKTPSGWYTSFTDENGSTIRYNFYVVLANNLDFKSKYSYVNYKTTEFGDVNQDGKIEGLMQELNSGNGFPMIGKEENEDFYMYFDGLNHSISNFNYNIVNTDADKTIYLSLFGYYDGSFSSTNIVNLNLENVDINVDTVGNAYIAPLQQQIHWYNSNQIKNIKTSGKINAKCGGKCTIGGVGIGVFTYGSPKALSNIKSTVNINVESNNAVVGGVLPVGSNYGYYVEDTNYTGNINVKATSEASVGGIYGGDRSFFYAVNSSVIGDITVETNDGNVHGLGVGSSYNSFYRGNINVKSYYPLSMAGLSSGSVTNGYVIGNITNDATYRYNWPGIAGVSSSGSVTNGYYIGNLYYDTETSYGGGGPTIYGSLLTAKGNVENSFVRGVITNNQKTSWSTYFGYLTTDDEEGTPPTITNGYVSSDTSYSGNAKCRKDGTIVTIQELKTKAWYKDELKFDNNWTIKDGYYPILNRCKFDNTDKSCEPTSEELSNQILIGVN